VLVIHYKTSQADEWVDRKESPIKRGGRTYRKIRQEEREIIPQVDGLVSVSEWARQAVLDWLPEAASVPSAVIGNFTEPMSPDPSPGSLADIVTTGSVERVKNHTYLLDILAETNRRGHQYTLDIFGQGMLIGELQRKARNLGVADQVRWRGFRTDVRSSLPGYRVYAHASYSESSSLAIMEAMAAGLPILAGKIGGVQELFDDGVEGKFWPLDNLGIAADMLVELLDSEDRRQAMAEASRKRYYGYYDSAVVVPRLLKFLQG
jgi:glycosyltransferase involved in cell wall biosynthesis